MTILDDIVAVKRQEITAITLTNEPRTSTPISFYERVQAQPNLAIIAEIKRASPSKGIINSEVDPVAQAKAYEAAGASAISVLTDEQFFKGSMADLIAVKQAVTIPVLNKDFIIARNQIERAYLAGADIILLIVAILSDDELNGLYQFARALQLDVLVEVHNAEEMARAKKLGARIIGINHRNLHDFSVNLQVTPQLLQQYPKEQAIIIAESGVKNVADAEQLASFGSDGLLVGETLMRSGNVETTLHALQVKRHAY